MNQIIEKLNTKKQILLSETQQFNDRNSLCKSVLFTTLRKQVRNYKIISSIDFALYILSGKYADFNTIQEAYISSIPDHLQNIWADKYAKIEAIFERLPICKKQVKEFYYNN